MVLWQSMSICPSALAESPTRYPSKSTSNPAATFPSCVGSTPKLGGSGDTSCTSQATAHLEALIEAADQMHRVASLFRRERPADQVCILKATTTGTSEKGHGDVLCSCMGWGSRVVLVC